jgi:prolyl-tRNA synthetase
LPVKRRVDLRLSHAYIPTQKEIPTDAVIPSHQLMIRAGLIRQLSAGIYSYLPLGWRIIKKVINIIREEMDRIGGQELHLPALNPVELWDETGRNTDFGDEMFHLNDRKNRILVLAPTHEEVICDLARKYIRSYKDLPQIWYQIQGKFRDEPRPRSGVLRARQFIMKDSYTLDIDEEALSRAYKLHDQAYRNIFTRCGLKFHVVGASSGLMGGSGSQEFMAESEHGEDTLVLCGACGYSANLDIAKSIPEVVQEKKTTLSEIHTPGKKTIEEVSTFLKIDPIRLMKSLVYVNDNGPLMVLIRGDHDINETKLVNHFGPSIRSAHSEEVKEACGAEIGFIGPVNMRKTVPIYADITLKNQHNLITGANKNEYHIAGIELNRDLSNIEFLDLRSVKENENCSVCGKSVKIIKAIELGHIFKLGTKYSVPMKANYLDHKGKTQPILMGSYGIGIERIIASLIEQNCDERGIVWEKHLTPYKIHILPINIENTDILNTANELYQRLSEFQLEPVLDDRLVTPGFKFMDADLLGFPLQVIIGKKYLEEGQIEIKERQTGKKYYCESNNLLNKVHSFFNI